MAQVDPGVSTSTTRKAEMDHAKEELPAGRCRPYRRLLCSQELLDVRKDCQDNARFQGHSPQRLCSNEDEHLGETHHQVMFVRRSNTYLMFTCLRDEQFNL